jgi:hypothetical protein
LTQGFDANPTWLALQLKTNVASGKLTVAGRSWTIYQNPVPGDQPKTRDFLIETKVANDEILLYGTAGKADFRQLAGAVETQIAKVYK